MSGNSFERPGIVKRLFSGILASTEATKSSVIRQVNLTRGRQVYSLKHFERTEQVSYRAKTEHSCYQSIPVHDAHAHCGMRVNYYRLHNHFQELSDIKYCMQEVYINA